MNAMIYKIGEGIHRYYNTCPFRIGDIVEFRQDMISMLRGNGYLGLTARVTQECYGASKNVQPRIVGDGPDPIRNSDNRLAETTYYWWRWKLLESPFTNYRLSKASLL